MSAGPRQTLGPAAAVAITVGIVVGAGIFRTPALVAGASASGTEMLLAWALGGLLSIIGALTYAELATTYPSAGGDYHFLARAFGRRLAFLHGWARLAIIQTGSMALLAYVVGDYMTEVVPLGPGSSAVWAALVIVAVTALNWAGVALGARAQMALTLIEIAGLGAIIVAGLLLAPAAPPAPAPAGETAFGLVMVFVLLTFGGWSEAAYVSAELRDARRRMAWVLIGSLALITALYLLVNLAYLNALGLAGIAAAPAVAAELMRRVAGEGGAAFISLAIAVAALTSANATAFTGARSAWALGRDFPRLGWLGRWRAQGETPGNALLAQGGAALLLVGLGALDEDGFRTAVDYTAPAFWLFMLLVGLALFVLRGRDPAAARPFRVPLYPVVPAVFVATNAYLLWSSLAYTGRGALVSLGVLAAGGLVLLILRPASGERADGRLLGEERA